MTKRIIAFIICFSLVFEQTGSAQVGLLPAIPAYLNSVAPVADKFRPVHLRSIEFDPAAGKFELLLDKGDAKDTDPDRIETTAQELFKYFKIGLTLPNSTFWVNLRPDSPDQVIDPLLEKTDVGKVLLEADLQLKKDLSRLTSPDTQDGRQYWNKLYEKATRIYGNQDVDIPTVTRPWIVPGEIIIRAGERSAFVYKAMLKVMLEQDYLKDAASADISDPRQKELNSYSSQLIREIIIPKLTREVNSSKRYAPLRQVYYSLILAQSHKQKKSGSFAARIDSRDLSGLMSQAAWSKDTYYREYRRSFQEGEYNKQEQVVTEGGVTIRQYFSGGIMIAKPPDIVTEISPQVDGGFLADKDPSFARLTIDSGAGDVSLQRDGGEADKAKDLEGKARVKMETDKYQEALVLLSEAQKVYSGIPDDGEIRCELKIIGIKIKLNKFQEAYAGLRTITQLIENALSFPERWQGHLALLWDSLSRKMLEENRYQEAVFFLERLAEYKYVKNEKGNAASLWELIARVYVDNLQDPERALRALGKAKKAYREEGNFAGETRCKIEKDWLFPLVLKLQQERKKPAVLPARPGIGPKNEPSRSTPAVEIKVPEEIKPVASDRASHPPTEQEMLEKRGLIDIRDGIVNLTPKGIQSLKRKGVEVPEGLETEKVRAGRPASLQKEDVPFLRAVLKQMIARQKTPVTERLIDKALIAPEGEWYELTVKGIQELMRRTDDALPEDLTRGIIPRRGRPPLMETDELDFLKTLIPQEQAVADNSGEDEADLSLKELSESYAARQKERKIKSTFDFFERMGIPPTDVTAENTPSIRRTLISILETRKNFKDKGNLARPADIFDLSRALFEIVGKRIEPSKIEEIVRRFLQEPDYGALSPYFVSYGDPETYDTRENASETIDLWFLNDIKNAGAGRGDGGAPVFSVPRLNSADYFRLSEDAKEALRNEFLRRLKPAPIVFGGGTVVDMSNKLVEDGNMQKLVAAAQELNELTSKYPNARLVSLGRTPLVYLDAARILKGEAGEYIYAAFSGRWYSRQTLSTAGPDREQIKAYREYLDRIGLNPAEINRQARAGKKTVLIEFVSSGGSLNSFLSILNEWARALNEDEALKKSLVIHLLQNPGSVKIDHWEGYEATQQAIGDKLLWLLMDQDSLGISYPYEKWTHVKINEAYPLTDISDEAALVRFRVTDFLAQNKYIAEAAGADKRIVPFALDRPDAGVVLEGRFAVTEAGRSRYLKTYGLFDCVAVTVRDPRSGVAGLAHLAVYQDTKASVQAMLGELTARGVASPAALEFTLIGPGTGERTKEGWQLVRDIREALQKTGAQPAREDIEGTEVRDILFDTATGAYWDMSGIEKRDYINAGDQLSLHGKAAPLEEMSGQRAQDSSSTDGGRDTFFGDRFIDLLRSGQLPLLPARSVLYPGSAFDVTHPLYLFDAEDLVFVDVWDFERQPNAKQTNGPWSVAPGGLIYYGSEPNVKEPLLELLTRIGAANIKVSKERQDVYRVSFDWAHPVNKRTISRTITYINRNVANSRELIEELHPGPFDAYFQKASKIHETNSGFAQWALGRVRLGGSIVVDQPGFFKGQRIANNFRSLPLAPGEPIKFGYGQLSLWQKTRDFGEDLSKIDGGREFVFTASELNMHIQSSMDVPEPENVRKSYERIYENSNIKFDLKENVQMSVEEIVPSLQNKITLVELAARIFESASGEKNKILVLEDKDSNADIRHVIVDGHHRFAAIYLLNRWQGSKSPINVITVDMLVPGKRGYTSLAQQDLRLNPRRISDIAVVLPDGNMVKLKDISLKAVDPAQGVIFEVSGNAPRDGDITVNLDAYPATDMIKQKSKTAYAAVFTDAAFREYIERHIIDLANRKYGGESGSPVTINSIDIRYENRGGFKDIFRISARVSSAGKNSFTGEVDLCMAALRPYYEALKGKMSFSATTFGNDFRAEFHWLRDYYNQGGADRHFVVEPYGLSVHKTGNVLYYLREWIEGDTVDDALANKLMGADKVEDIVSAWMKVVKVLNKYARNPGLSNIMVRADGSFVIADLGIVAAINERMVIRSFDSYYGSHGFADAPAVRTAIFAGVINGLGEIQGRNFLHKAFEQGPDEKFALELKRFLDGGEDAVDKIELRDKWVRVLSRSTQNSRSKTLASVYAVTLNPDLDAGGTLLWFGPMEVSGFTVAQCIEMVKQLAGASQNVKDKLGISAELTMADLLAKYYVVVEDKMLVALSNGEIRMVKVPKKDITSIGFNKGGRKGDLLKTLAQKKANLLDGGSDGTGNVDPVAEIGFLNNKKIVAVFSPFSPHRITLATFVRKELSPAGDAESGIVFVRPREVSRLTREQASQIVVKFAEKLAHASPDSDVMRKIIGIEGKDTLAEVLADDYLVIGNNLVVMAPDGEILIGAIDFYDQIRYWFSSSGKWDSGPMYRSITEKRGDDAAQLSKDTFLKGLPELKAKMLAEHAAKKDGGLISEEELRSVEKAIELINGLAEDKAANREMIAAALLSITRQGKRVFSPSQVGTIMTRRELGARLKEVLEYLLYLPADKGGRKTFQFSGTHMALIIRRRRGLEEIKSFITELKKREINEGMQITHIIISGRSLIEVLLLVKNLKLEGIKDGSNLAFIINSGRSLAEIRPLIKELKTRGIKEGKHIAMITHSRRSLEEIKDLIDVLEERGIKEGNHIASIVASGRSSEDILLLMLDLESAGIKEASHVSGIVGSGRSPADIKELIGILGENGIKDGNHVSQIIRSRRSKEEVGPLIQELKSKGIIIGNHIVLIVTSSRDPQESMKLIGDLAAKGITDPAHIAQIISSARSPEDIKSLIADLGSKGIKEGNHVAWIVDSIHRPEEIGDLIRELKLQGIIEGNNIAEIIHGGLSLPEVREVISVLRENGIIESSPIAMIFHSARGLEEIKELIGVLQENGIKEGNHIARIIRGGRGQDEIRFLIRELGRKGIKESSHVSLIIRSGRDSTEILQLIDSLATQGIQEAAHVVQIMISARSPGEIKELIGVLQANGIQGKSSIARIVRTGRTQEEIVLLIKALASMGMNNDFQISRIIHSGYSAEEIPGMVSKLKAEGLNDFQIGTEMRTKNPKQLFNEDDADELDGGITDDGQGGIDFRALPITGQPVQGSDVLRQLQDLAARSKISDLDAEWRAIENQMQTADMPYTRIQEYIAVCTVKPGSKKRLDQVSICLMNILRLEEDQALPTHAELKAILACLG